MTTRTRVNFEQLPTNYQGLCGVLPPRPIRDQVDYRNVVEIMDAMVLHEEEFSQDQADYFEMLCRVVEDYEAEQVQWPEAGGLEALKHLMEEHRMSGADLSRLLGGSRNLGAMILRGERSLTVGHIATLAKHFGVEPGLFMAVGGKEGK